jgi:hypothetical protein
MNHPVESNYPSNLLLLQPPVWIQPTENLLQNESEGKTILQAIVVNEFPPVYYSAVDLRKRFDLIPLDKDLIEECRSGEI